MAISKLACCEVQSRLPRDSYHPIVWKLKEFYFDPIALSAVNKSQQPVFVNSYFSEFVLKANKRAETDSKGS